MSNEINPFASPPETEDLARGDRAYHQQVGPPYASASARAKWTNVIMAGILIASFLIIGSTLMQVSLLERMKVGNFDLSEPESNDMRQQAIGIIRIVLGLASVVAFLMWFHRAHRNLPSLGNSGLKYSPGWAVGGWFVPFLNLVRPYQVMNEIWGGSDPEAVREGRESWYGRSYTIPGWWWGLFLVMGFIGNISSHFMNGATQLDELITASWVIVALNTLTIPAAIVTILMVHRTTADQDERIALIEGSASGDGMRSDPYNYNRFPSR
ncbi:MAG: DUF4328 domain-containing protein [Pirellulales bacterium]|nr:DUF4328 domain-containing protein [Pirellulales bacterium]